ncbi:EF-hand domain-containing protein [Entamoeba marina]
MSSFTYYQQFIDYFQSVERTKELVKNEIDPVLHSNCKKVVVVEELESHKSDDKLIINFDKLNQRELKRHSSPNFKPPTLLQENQTTSSYYPTKLSKSGSSIIDEKIEGYEIKDLVDVFPKEEWYFIFVCTKENQLRLSIEELYSLSQQLDEVHQIKQSKIDISERVAYMVKYLFNKFDRTKSGVITQKDLNFYYQISLNSNATSLLYTIKILQSFNGIDYPLFEKIMYNYVYFYEYQGINDELICCILSIANSIKNPQKNNKIPFIDGVHSLYRLDAYHFDIEKLMSCGLLLHSHSFSKNEFVRAAVLIKQSDISYKALVHQEEPKYTRMVTMCNLTYDVLDIKGQGIDFTTAKKYVKASDKKNTSLLNNLKKFFIKNDVDGDGKLNFEEFTKLFEKVMVFNFKKEGGAKKFVLETNGLLYQQMKSDLLISIGKRNEAMFFDETKTNQLRFSFEEIQEKPNFDDRLSRSDILEKSKEKLKTKKRKDKKQKKHHSTCSIM